MRLIDADALEEELGARYAFLVTEYGYRDHYTSGFEEAADKAEAAPTIDAVPVVRWIPVTERLPQQDEPVDALCENVQVLLSDGTVTVGWCNRLVEKWYYLPFDETHFYEDDYERTPVVAWQPLSAPPMRKGENG